MSLERAMALIKEFEGLRTEAYRCPAGVWTIGWGHTANVYPGLKISPEQAEELLRADVERLRSGLRAEGVRLGAQREAALLSFAFNVGLEALLGSTLWRKVRVNPDDRSIWREFARWKYAGGRVMNGLVRRRQAEAALYFSEP